MDKIKIPYSEWAEFHTRRGNGDFNYMRYGQAFYNYFNLRDKFHGESEDMENLFYCDRKTADEIISRRIEITNDDEEEK